MAAPVAIPEPEIAAAPTPPSDAQVVYEKTGDAGLDVALQYVGNLGFQPDSAAMQAAMKGDFSVLEAELTKLGDKAKGFEAYTALGKEAFGRRTAATKAAQEAIAKVVYDEVGGADKWAAIQAWAKENATDAERKSINAALNAGGVAARATAKELAGLFKRAGSPIPKAVVKADASATPPTGAAPLTADEFGRESEALYARLGRRMQDSSEYAALKARRIAGRNLKK